MMGCGKTTVAEVFSKTYGYKKVDTDEIIVERFGEISEIFAKFGEEHFRDLESEVAEEVANTFDNAVVSVGGGLVLRDRNALALKQNGKLIYLRARAQTIIRRLEGDNNRPLLNGDIKARVNSILSSRSTIYEKVADIIIDVDELTPQEIAKKIKESI